MTYFLTLSLELPMNVDTVDHLLSGGCVTNGVMCDKAVAGGHPTERAKWRKDLKGD